MRGVVNDSSRLRARSMPPFVPGIGLEDALSIGGIASANPGKGKPLDNLDIKVRLESWVASL